MGIREELDMNDPEVLRDLYLSEQIWNVGELVTADDKPYEIIRKGTNYVTVIDETYKTYKFWLHEISMYEMSGTALKKISQDFKDKSSLKINSNLLSSFDFIINKSFFYMQHSV